MRVFIGCEFSGVVREAFRRHGHDAYSCDLLPALDNSPHHLQGDVLQILEQSQYLPSKWDLGIFHPTCRYLANSGVKHLYKGGKGTVRDPERWKCMEDAARFFKRVLALPFPRLAVENPVMHGHAQELIGLPYIQIIQPWMFGHGEIKKTCLWLNRLPPLQPTIMVTGREPRVHFESPGVRNGLTREQRRSITLMGIADAMASQWGAE